MKLGFQHWRKEKKNRKPPEKKIPMGEWVPAIKVTIMNQSNFSGLNIVKQLQQRGNGFIFTPFCRSFDVFLALSMSSFSPYFQCNAVCCSVLQCVAVCCSVLQCVAVCCSVLQCVALCCCTVLKCVAVCCSVLQCVAVFSMAWFRPYFRVPVTKIHPRSSSCSGTRQRQK